MFGDLHVYIPANRSWRDLSVGRSGLPPSPRVGQAFSEAGGLLYVHGGCSDVSCIGTVKLFLEE